MRFHRIRTSFARINWKRTTSSAHRFRQIIVDIQGVQHFPENGHHISILLHIALDVAASPAFHRLFDHWQWYDSFDLSIVRFIADNHDGYIWSARINYLNRAAQEMRKKKKRKRTNIDWIFCFDWIFCTACRFPSLILIFLCLPAHALYTHLIS